MRPPVNVRIYCCFFNHCYYYWLLSLSGFLTVIHLFFLAVSRSGDSEVHSTTLDPRQEKRPRKEHRNGRCEGGRRGLGLCPAAGPAAVSQHERADGAHLHPHHSACHISRSIASSPAGTKSCRLLLLSLLAHLTPGIPYFASSSSSSSPAASFTCKGRRVSNRGTSSEGQESCRRRPPLPAWPIYPSLLRQQSTGQRP